MNEQTSPRISSVTVAETCAGAGIMATTALVYESELEVIPHPTARLIAGMAIGSIVLGHSLLQAARQTRQSRG